MKMTENLRKFRPLQILDELQRSLLKLRAITKVWFLLLALFGVWFVAPSTGSAEGRPQYPDGRFPPGPLFREENLAALAGQNFRINNTYLVGKFVYKGNQNGRDVFGMDPTKFDRVPGAARAVLIVRFFGNRPSNLRVGRLIAPNPRSPLTIRAVERTADGLLVKAEYLGTP
jgi:hypothetical protein